MAACDGNRYQFRRTGFSDFISPIESSGLAALKRRYASIVCRVEVPALLGQPKDSGTGVLIGGNLLLTCNHVIRSKWIAEHCVACFFGVVNQNISKSDTYVRILKIALDPDTFYFESKAPELGEDPKRPLSEDQLDFTVVALKSDPCLAGIQNLVAKLKHGRELDQGPLSESAFLVQHPNTLCPETMLRRTLQAADGSIVSVGRFALVHNIPSTGGSSGGAVVDRNGNFIAMHVRSGMKKIAIQVKLGEDAWRTEEVRSSGHAVLTSRILDAIKWSDQVTNYRECLKTNFADLSPAHAWIVWEEAWSSFSASIDSGQLEDAFASACKLATTAESLQKGILKTQTIEELREFCTDKDFYFKTEALAQILLRPVSFGIKREASRSISILLELALLQFSLTGVGPSAEAVSDLRKVLKTAIRDLPVHYVGAYFDLKCASFIMKRFKPEALEFPKKLEANEIIPLLTDVSELLKKEVALSPAFCLLYLLAEPTETYEIWYRAALELMWSRLIHSTLDESQFEAILPVLERYRSHSTLALAIVRWLDDALIELDLEMDFTDQTLSTSSSYGQTSSSSGSVGHAGRDAYISRLLQVLANHRSVHIPEKIGKDYYWKVRFFALQQMSGFDEDDRIVLEIISKWLSPQEPKETQDFAEGCLVDLASEDAEGKERIGKLLSRSSHSRDDVGASLKQVLVEEEDQPNRQNILRVLRNYAEVERAARAGISGAVLPPTSGTSRDEELLSRKKEQRQIALRPDRGRQLVFQRQANDDVLAVASELEVWLSDLS